MKALRAAFRLLNRRSLTGLLSASLLSTGLLFTGCVSTRGWPEVDLNAPGWSVRTGQALWQPREAETALAGDLIVAQHTSGDVMIDFSKSALPIFTARTFDRAWSLQLIHRKRSYSGRGRPPARFLWFRLPQILNGKPPPDGWELEQPADDEWQLTRLDSSESIRLILDP